MQYYFTVEGDVYRLVKITCDRDGRCCLLQQVYTEPGQEKKTKLFSVDYVQEYLCQTHLWGEPGEYWDKPDEDLTVDYDYYSE